MKFKFFKKVASISIISILTSCFALHRYSRTLVFLLFAQWSASREERFQVPLNMYVFFDEATEIMQINSIPTVFCIWPISNFSSPKPCQYFRLASCPLPVLMMYLKEIA